MEFRFPLGVVVAGRGVHRPPRWPVEGRPNRRIV